MLDVVDSRYSSPGGKNSVGKDLWWATKKAGIFAIRRYLIKSGVLAGIPVVGKLLKTMKVKPSPFSLWTLIFEPSGEVE